MTSAINKTYRQSKPIGSRTMASTRESEVDLARRRAIFDVVQSFIGLISTDGILLDANKSALDFIGCDLGDVEGSPFWETPWWRGCDSSRIALRNAIRLGVAGETSRFEVRLTGHDDRIIDADFSLTPVRNETGEVVFLVPEARNIADVKASKSALQETKARLSLAYDAAEIGAWDLDLTTNNLYWSDRQYELFDVSQTSEKTDFETAISRIHPDDRDRVVENTRSAIRDNRPYRDEFRVVHRNGEVRWLIGHGRPLQHDEEGKPRAMIGVNYDITDRKSAELELAQINRELEARVTERTQELEREMREREDAQETLAHSQRLDAIGQLAGGVAHDFNNLLAVIGGNLELVAARVTDERTIGMIRDALDAVETGASLNNRLLSFARKSPLDARMVSVNDRVEYAWGLLERTLDKNIALNMELDDDIQMAFIDSGEFDSALLNLVVNARDAMPSGGAISIKTTNEAFTDDDLRKNPSLKEKAYVKVSVTDTGVGMSPEVLERAMTPFFTTKDAGQGSGLGLSSVFGFARQSGGFVTLDSREGNGTTVDIYLPRAPLSNEDAGLQQAPAPVPRGTGQLVLAVEDDEAVLSVTRKRLLALGYSVTEARNAAAAIGTLERGQPVSLVFSDIHMPGALNGYDLAKWVAEHRPEIRVLLTSGYNDPKGHEHRDAAVLDKPYSMRKLAVALKSAFE